MQQNRLGWVGLSWRGRVWKPIDKEEVNDNVHKREQGVGMQEGCVWGRSVLLRVALDA